MDPNDAQAEILQRLTRVETKLDMQLNAKDIANEALLSARAAHHRIDLLQKIILWAGSSLMLGMAGLIWKGWGH